MGPYGPKIANIWPKKRIRYLILFDTMKRFEILTFDLSSIPPLSDTFFHSIRYRYDIWFFSLDAILLCTCPPAPWSMWKRARGEKRLARLLPRQVLLLCTCRPPRAQGKKNKKSQFSIDDTRYWRFYTRYSSILWKVSRSRVSIDIWYDILKPAACSIRYSRGWSQSWIQNSFWNRDRTIFLLPNWQNVRYTQKNIQTNKQTKIEIFN